MALSLIYLLKSDVMLNYKRPTYKNRILTQNRRIISNVHIPIAFTVTFPSPFVFGTDLYRPYFVLGKVRSVSIPIKQLLRVDKILQYK